MKYRFFFIVLALLALTTVSQGQLIDDALRLAMPATTVGARSFSMGNAFVAVADDYSATYWNPAGLGLLRRPELALGLMNISASNDVAFLNTRMQSTTSKTRLNNVGFALPFPTMRGSLVFAVGYNRIQNYNASLAFNALDGTRSIIPVLKDPNQRFDLAWKLWLQDDKGETPFDLGLRQSGDVLESGGMNAWTFTGSLEAARNVFVGLTLNLLSGSYKWERTWVEEDVNDVYQDAIVQSNEFDTRDFQYFQMNEKVKQDISGWNVRMGFLYKIQDYARIGAVIETPTFYTVTEDYYRQGISKFAYASATYDFTTLSDHSVTTPWRFSFGASGRPLKYLTLAFQMDYSDLSETEFSNITDIGYESDLNKSIRNSWKDALVLAGGVELTVPKTPLQIRAGYNYQTSPWKRDEGRSEYNVKTLTAGMGYLFSETFQLNVMWGNTTYKTFHYNYDPYATVPPVPESAVRTDEDVSQTYLMFSLAYRF